MISTLAPALALTTSAIASTPYGIGCASDVTVDGEVDVSDVLLVINQWGSTDPALDIDGDGVVAVGDILAIITEWGTDCGSIHPFRDNMMVYINYAGGQVLVAGTGLPDHPWGPFDGSTGCHNPNTPSDQDDLWHLPLLPVPTNNPAVDVLSQMGPIAVTINGVAFYNPYDGGGVQAPGNICFDDYNGHPSPDGRYHYHQWSPAFEGVETDGHSVICGYAFDGYPIFGPYESDGVPAQYLTGGNALDDCNGHTDSIRGYHYHTSLPWEQEPDGFPWVIGCYSGEPEESNFAGGGGPPPPPPPPYRGRGAPRHRPLPGR